MCVLFCMRPKHVSRQAFLRAAVVLITCFWFCVYRACGLPNEAREAAALLIKEHWEVAESFQNSYMRDKNAAKLHSNIDKLHPADRLAIRLSTSLPPAHALISILRSSSDLMPDTLSEDASFLEADVVRNTIFDTINTAPRKGVNSMSEQKALDLGGGGVEPGTEGFDPILASAEPNKECREKANKYRTECLFGTSFNSDAP